MLGSLLGGGDLLSHFRSTIGAVRFNFSVRNGKRWSPHAITTLVLSVLSLFTGYRRYKVKVIYGNAPPTFLAVVFAISPRVLRSRRPDGSLSRLTADFSGGGFCRSFFSSGLSQYHLDLPYLFPVSNLFPFLSSALRIPKGRLKPPESFRAISIARLGPRSPCTCNLSTS